MTSEGAVAGPILLGNEGEALVAPASPPGPPPPLPMMKLPVLSLFIVFLVMVATAAEAEWELVATTGGIKVWNREKAGTPIKEVMTSGLVEAPTWRVLKVVTDHDHYADFMPYTRESRILSKEENVVHFYTRVAPPLISVRDYTLRLVSTRVPGKEGHFLTRFTQANDRGPAPVSGIVRVEIVSGYWLIEPAGDGSQTRLTYYVFTAPGGSVPDGLANRANTQSVPGIIKAVRERVRLPVYDCRDGDDADCDDWKAIAK